MVYMVFIAFEGVDGAGKTATITYLKNNYKDHISLSSQSYFLPKLRNTIDENLKNFNMVTERVIYYLAMNKFSNFEIEEIKRSKPDNIIMLDRYWYSTLASHIAYDKVYCKGKNANNIRSLVNASHKDLINPDIVVFLSVDSNIRKLRTMIRREKNIGDNPIYFNNDILFDEYETEFKSIAEQLKREGRMIIEIDTTKLGISEAADIVEKSLRSLKNHNIKQMVKVL